MEKIFTDPKTLKILTFLSYCLIYIEGDVISGLYIILLLYGLVMVLSFFNLLDLLLLLLPITGSIGLFISIFSKEKIKKEYLITVCFVAMLSPFLYHVIFGQPNYGSQVLFYITFSIFISFGILMLISVYMKTEIKGTS